MCSNVNILFGLSRSLWPRWISMKQLGADLSRMMTRDNPVGKGIEEEEDAQYSE
jgi:hypothetical protein